MKAIVATNSLRQALDAAIEAADSPHFDLGPFLGTQTPVKIGLIDMHELLQHGEPALELEFEGKTLTVRPTMQGPEAKILASFEVPW